MFDLLSSLELYEYEEDFWMNNALLLPFEFQYHCSETPRDLLESERAWENDKFVIQRYSVEAVSWWPRLRVYWLKLFGGGKVPFYIARECYLPVNYPTSIPFLKACVNVSETLKMPELFDNEVISGAVDCAWITYGQSSHVLLMGIYILLLAAVTTTNYTLHDWIISGDSSLAYTTWSLLALLFFINSLLVCIELSQLMGSYLDERIIEYFTDMQNYLDWASYGLLYSALGIRTYEQRETYTSSSIMAVTTILLWLKFLYFLRPFKSTGPLVRMIFFIFSSIKELIGILVFVIFGFSQSMYLLAYADSSLDFSDPMTGIINSFLYMMGASQLSQMQQASNPQLAQFLLCIFIFIATILMLNLLIALMNNSYGTIQTHQEAEWNRERAKIIVEQFRPWRLSLKPNVYFLARAVDRDDVKRIKGNSGSARLTRIEKKLAEDNELLKGELAEVKSLLGKIMLSIKINE